VQPRDFFDTLLGQHRDLNRAKVRWMHEAIRTLIILSARSCAEPLAFSASMKEKGLAAHEIFSA